MMDVSRETEQRLALYVDLLRRWQRIKNLVGPSTLPLIWTRHIADSAQLLPLAPQAMRWLDMGTGAGFPGLVIAILLQSQRRDGAVVHLVESNGRKCAFLRDVVREVGCPAIVHDARVEMIVPTLLDVDVVTSRALAPLPALLEMGKSPLNRGATGMFLKSAAEIDAIESGQRIGTWTIVPSRTSQDGRIVLITMARCPPVSKRDHYRNEDPLHD